MVTKKTLRVANDNLNEEMDELNELYDSQSRELIQIRKENIKLISEQVELLNTLERKQIQLDQEIASRLELERMMDSLKRTNNSQSKKITVLMNTFVASRENLRRIDVNFSNAIQFPI